MIRESPPQAVIFDFDDTLVRLNVDWHSVADDFRCHAEDIGCRRRRGEHLMTFAARLSDTPAHKHTVDKIIAEHEQRCIETCGYEPFPEMLDLVRAIRKRQLKLAIVSGNTTRTVGRILDKLDLLACFDLVCGRDTVPRPKPHPEAVVYAVDLLQVSRVEVLFIGDSVNDKKAAAEAGVPFLKVQPTSSRHRARITRIVLGSRP